jgi:hypothetical protein
MNTMLMEKFDFRYDRGTGRLLYLEYRFSTTPWDKAMATQLAENERGIIEGFVLDELQAWEPRDPPLRIETGEGTEYLRRFGFEPPPTKHPVDEPEPPLYDPLKQYFRFLVSNFYSALQRATLSATLHQIVPLNGNIPILTLQASARGNERAFRLHERIWRHRPMDIGETAGAGCELVASLPR